MRQGELIFIDHLNAKGINQNPEGIAHTAVGFLEENLPEADVCLFRHIYKPDCYSIETSSPNAEKYLNQLIKTSKRSFKKHQMIYEIKDLLIFPLSDDHGKVQYIFLIAPANKVNRQKLGLICDDIQKIFCLATVQIRQYSKSSNEKMAQIISQIAHDLNSLATQIPSGNEKDSLSVAKKNYAVNLSREIMFYIRELETVRTFVSVRDLLDGIVAGISLPENVRLQTEYDDDVGYIQVDVELMDQAFSALLQNAIFASSIDGGQVTIMVMELLGRRLLLTRMIISTLLT